MIILADTAGWNSIITNVLLVLHVVCLLLCLVVLMQRPKQEGLGAAFGGGMTDQAFGARTTDVLQKGTVFLGSLLFFITLVLSILVGTKASSKSISAEIESSGVAAIEENAEAAAALLDKTKEELTADAIAGAMKEATGEGDQGKDSAEDESPTAEEGEGAENDVEEVTPAPTDPAPTAPSGSTTPE